MPKNTPATTKGKLQRLVKFSGCLLSKRKRAKNGMAKKLRQKMVSSGGKGIQRPRTPEVLMNRIARLS